MAHICWGGGGGGVRIHRNLQLMGLWLVMGVSQKGVPWTP